MKKLVTFLTAAVVIAACGDDSPGTASPKATTDAEKAELAFLQDMFPHHAQAVEMAKACESRAAHTELKSLCSTIIKDQEREIAEMRSWAKAWYGADVPEKAQRAHGGGHGEGGMQSEDDVKALSALSGTAFDLRFIEMMTAHHRGAVETAQKIKDTAVHPEVRTLAGNIIASQSQEIDQMAAWKRAWL